jgi:prepilin-type N-terminal cleavage/methylation domain-containing protein
MLTFAIRRFIVHHPAPRRAAFTLLELSVVLVIIGLLAGGAVTARNLIKNSELSSMMTESKYYMNAWGQFQAKYNALPGDFPGANAVWPSTTSGNGNGQLTSADADTTEDVVSFQHLSLAGFIDGSYSGTALLPTISPGVNIPKSSVQGAVYFFDHPNFLDGSVSGDAFYIDGFYGHVLRAAGKLVPSVGAPSENILTPAQTLSLDIKYDDGIPASGAVMTPKKDFMGGCITDNDPATSQYDTADTSKICSLVLKLP